MGFSAVQSSIGKILKTEKEYVIPKYQRKYIWGNKQWEDLFEDIRFSIKHSKKEHFIGNIIIEESSQNHIIIDGQQRITTITLLLAVISKQFLLLKDNNSSNGLNNYIVFKNLDYINTLVINISYDYYYGILIDEYTKEQDKNLEKYLENKNIDNTYKTNNYVKCYKCFEKLVEKELNDISEKEKKLEYLKQLRDCTLKLNVIYISSDKEQEGYMIFETLNARGLPLEQHELIKNYIFAYANSSAGADNIKTKWNQIENNLIFGQKNSLKKFISHYMIHKYGKILVKDFYSTIKENVLKDNTEEFLNDLLNKSRIYNIIETTNYELSNTVKYVLDFLKKFNNFQFRPILLSLFSAREKEFLSSKELELAMLKIKNFISIYVLVCKNKTNTLEKTIYEYSCKLSKDFNKTILDEFLCELSGKSPSKDEFCECFIKIKYASNREQRKKLKYNNKKEIYYILKELEFFEAEIKDYTLSDFTIEHIKDNCEGGESSSIGNMVSLIGNKNNKLSGKKYKQKLAVYKDSGFKNARNFYENYKNKEWNDYLIRERAQKMSEKFHDYIWTFK